MDVMAAIALIGVLLVLMSSTVTSQRNASGRLADRRAATQAAEAALIALQSGGAPADEAVSVRAAADAPESAAGRWVEVEAVRGDERVTLTGLVPADAAIGGTP
jgi:type II secretory pathway pseudopilin PulG